MAFASDTFTDTAGTTLQTHVATLGGTWSRHTTFANNMVISAVPGNTVRPSTGSATEMYYLGSATPASAEYDVECDLNVVQLTTGHAAGVAGRISSGANTAYFARYLVGTGLQLFKVVAGTSTQLGSTVSGDLTAGQTYHIKLEIRDATKKLYLGGVEQISSTDNAITSAGAPGIRCSTGATTGDANGIHIDNWVATDAPVTSSGGRNMLLLGVG